MFTSWTLIPLSSSYLSILRYTSRARSQSRMGVAFPGTVGVTPGTLFPITGEGRKTFFSFSFFVPLIKDGYDTNRYNFSLFVSF